MRPITPVFRQRLLLVASVLLMHALALWALQSGLLQRFVALAQETVVPVEAIAELPRPLPTPPAQTPPPDKAAPVRPRNAEPAPMPAPPVLAAAAAPAPLAVADSAATPGVPSGVAVTQAAAPTQPAAAAPAPPKLELPSSNADYLHNPKPKYPRLSQGRNEQGTVLLSVGVGQDGKVREVVLKTSSGFELLDRAAREAVLTWTFVPGKRNGVPMEMSVDVPIVFRSTE